MCIRDRLWSRLRSAAMLSLDAAYRRVLRNVAEARWHEGVPTLTDFDVFQRLRAPHLLDLLREARIARL
eukprot:6228118-Lingulodinium_polyedra.AAC.1